MGRSTEGKLGSRFWVRVCFDILFVCMLLFAPWQATLAFGVVGAFFFPSFFELVAAGIFFDLLYAPSALALGSFVGTIAGAVLYGSIEYTKTHLRWY